MARFPLGYKQDPENVGYPSHHSLIAAGPPTLPSANHLPYRKGIVWQDGVGMCVGAWLKRAVQLWTQMNGFGSSELISAAAAYAIGRAQEHAGTDPDSAPPLADVGSYPSLVLLGAQNVGLVLEDDYPDPTSPAWDISTVNRRPTSDQLVKAYDMRGLEFFGVSPGAFGFKESIRACMVRRQPVGVSMFVDTGVMDNAGEVVITINPLDPHGGGHMIGFLDASRDDYAVLDNWWKYAPRGIEWGVPEANPYDLPSGVWRVSWSLLERSIIQCLAVKGAPLIRKAA